MVASDRQIGGDHYKQFIYEPFNFFTQERIPFGEATVLKYVLREKNREQDFEKACHCIDLILQYKNEDRITINWLDFVDKNNLTGYKKMAVVIIGLWLLEKRDKDILYLKEIIENERKRINKKDVTMPY